MKPWLLLLVLAIGCGGGGGDDDDTGGAVALRTVFTREAATTNHVIFDGDAAIQSGDQVIVLLEASVDDIALTQSDGWTVLADAEAVLCTGQFHTWFLAGPAGTAFDFTFDVEASFAAIVTAYSGGNVELMKFVKMGELRNMPINYEAATLAANSAIWMGGGAQTTWSALDSPVGVDSLIAIQNAAAFQLVTADGAVPMIELPNDNGFCANVAQISIEP